MKSQIPTLLAIFLLIGTLVAILFVKNKVQTINSNANASFAPHDLRITNIKDSSFTVSWLTDVQTASFVEYTSSNGQVNKTPASNLSTTHFVVIDGLNSNTNYSIRVNSGGQFFSNNDSPWEVQTQNTSEQTAGEIVSGKIVTKNNLPAKNSLVYVETPGNTFFSALVATSGNWIISLPPLASTTILQIIVEDASSVSSAKVDLKSANPTPTITLGTSYDFTNSETAPTSGKDIPKVQIILP